MSTDYINRDEITRNAELGKSMLSVSEPNMDIVSGEDTKTYIMDAIANLLILGQEEEVNIADCITDGVAHFCATYMEGMEPQQAEEWLNAALFPFTGDRQFAEYIADRAIVLAGFGGKFETPEWGV